MLASFSGGLRVAPPQPRHVAPIARVAPPSTRGGDTVDWVAATSTLFDKDSRPIMLFDVADRRFDLSVQARFGRNTIMGVCNLCNGGVKFVRDNDRNRRIRYEALQSEPGKKLLRRSGRAPDDISSVVLVEKDRSYIKSEAVLKIMEYIDLPFPQLAFFLQFVPLFIRDFVYDNVANNRKRMKYKLPSSQADESYYEEQILTTLVPGFSVSGAIAVGKVLATDIAILRLNEKDETQEKTRKEASNMC